MILSALLSFADSSEDQHVRRDENTSSTSSGFSFLKPTKSSEQDPPAVPPELPPKPAQPEKTPITRIVDMQTGALNEIVVSEDGDVGDYAQYCANLLEVRFFLL